MKRIAVEQGLEDIKNALEGRGYEIVDANDGGHIDAIVYRSIYDGLKNLNNSVDSNAYGAILINVNNKTIDEIQQIIETRRYENLFT